MTVKLDDILQNFFCEKEINPLIGLKMPIM